MNISAIKLIVKLKKVVNVHVINFIKPIIVFLNEFNALMNTLTPVANLDANVRV
tara:strand:+ start:74296 stop:74457 length:162 start_codon:yes stop_codon:yes gene_type:complete